MTPDQAKRVLSRSKFIQSYNYESPDNPEFFVYTRDIIYRQKVNDETGERHIEAIPRQPTAVAMVTGKNIQIKIPNSGEMEALCLGGAASGAILPEN